MSMTVTAADARAQFSRIADQVARTGSTVTVFKNSRPWVEIHPVGSSKDVLSDSTRQALREAAALKEAGARFSSFRDMMSALEADSVEN
ncbi:MAG: type II toxin-antitoxin system Phd/YefM family antitoxin [Micrococcales bacterium]|nr:type II toxin-antitoxin system Phd/YefM family antitoxin [Micrococcales bacterium]